MSPTSALKTLSSLLTVSLLALAAPLQALAGGGSPPPPPPPAAAALSVQGQNFVDAQGRVVILRGYNVAGDSKVPPFRALSDFSELDPLPTWGVNVIRLLFTWEAYEPTRGSYDQGYLDYITQIADEAWARGMFVIIDIHQDVFSRYLADGCGEGFPLWAVSPDANIDQPDNGPGCADWATKGLLDPDMHLSWSDFYADRFGVRTRYLALLDTLASHFAGHAGVVGYDLLNEPWGWEAAELLPLYEDAAATIRAQDPNAILFIEGHVSTNNGALQTTLPKPSFSNFAYAPHFYDAGVLLTKLYSGLTTPADVGFSNMKSKADEWGVPLFLGEFGAFNGTWNVGAYMDLIYRKLNETLASGTQWNYTPGWTPQDKDGWNAEDLSVVDDQGNPQPTFELRPAAQQVAGTPTQITVADNGREIELKWDHNPSAGATKLFVPKQALFGSKNVKIETEGWGLSCGFDSTQSHVSCTSSYSGAKRVKVRECFMFWGTCY